jgi:hypothetical protein
VEGARPTCWPSLSSSSWVRARGEGRRTQRAINTHTSAFGYQHLDVASRLAGGHLLAAISTSIVGILREHYGEPDRVIAMREDFQRVMAERYEQAIEELAGP